MTTLGRIFPWRRTRPLELSAIAPVLRLISRRLSHHWRLHLATLAGLVVAIALVVAVPIFAEALATAQLRTELATIPADRAIPQSSMILTYLPPRGAQPLASDRYHDLSAWIAEQAPLAASMPVSVTSRSAQTEQLPFLLKPTSANTDGTAVMPTEPQSGVIAFLDGLEQHAQILEGAWPKPGLQADGTIEAVISTERLDEFGLRIGDRVDVIGRVGGQPKTIPVRIVGRWLPIGATEPDLQAQGSAYPKPSDVYWFNRPEAYRNALLVPEATFFDVVLATLPRSGQEFTWFFDFDSSSVRASQIDRMVTDLSQFQVEAGARLRGLRIDAAPDLLLESFQRRVFFLQILLFVLGAPVLGIVLMFIGSSASAVADRQRAEIAVLKSRGATTSQVIGTFLIEGVLIASVAAIIGTPLGFLLAVVLGQVRSFLAFGGGDILPARLGPEVYPYAVVAAALAISSMLGPAASAAGHSIVTLKQEMARVLQAPLWRRYYLDVLPLPIAAYAYYLLLQNRTVLPVGESGDVFADPLLLIAPAVGIFAATLPLLRFFPWLLTGLERVIGPVLPIGPLIALRQIARQPAAYTGLLLLLAVTVALGVFSAEVAATVDRNYDDAAAYRVGADLRVSETGALSSDDSGWTFLPVGDHLAVPGVLGASRAFRTSASTRIGAQSTEIQLLAVDAAELPAVIHWRRDYATRPLNELAGLVAGDELNLLVSRNLFESQHLQLGDQISIVVKDVPIEFIVAGVVDYFPTLYPDTERFVIANVDYVFDFLGPLPHDVWLRLAPDADPAAVVADLKSLEFPIVRDEALATVVEAQRSDVTRRGAFAMLSVGFAIAAGLTMLSILLTSYLSFRRRLQQIGVLRAIGLSLRQLVMLFLSEQLIVILTGIVVGTLLGVAAGRLFIPFLQIKSAEHAGIPPFTAVAAWGDVIRLYIVLGIFLAIVLPLSLALLRRVRIHEAIKFGEETG